MTNTNEPLITLDRNGAHVSSLDVTQKLEKKNISPSLITSLNTCPAKWLAESFVVRELVDEEPDNAARRGSLFHEIMEFFFKLPPNQRGPKELKQIVKEVTTGDTFGDIGTRPEVMDWLKDAINGYYSMGGKPQSVQVANIDVNGKSSEGLEVFVKGNIGNTDRDVLGFIDRVIVDQRSKNDAVIVEDWKGLSLNTPLPTPTGWTTMEQVQVGEQLLGTNGKATTVLEKSQIHKRKGYTVTFSDNSQVTSDNVHLWDIIVPEDAKNPNTNNPETITVDADELYQIWKNNSVGYVRIQNSNAISAFATEQFTIPPFNVGGMFGPFDHISEISKTLKELQKGKKAFSLNSYKRGSIEQRKQFLRAINSEWDEDMGMFFFYSKNTKALKFVGDVILSLGITPQFEFTNTNQTDGGRVGFWSYYDYGDTTIPDTLKPQLTQRYIVKIETLDEVETQCVKVDADNSLYLCGESMVPTHNTGAKPRIWKSHTKSDDGLAEQRQQIIYKMLLEKQDVNVSAARLIYPVARTMVGVDLKDTSLADRVVSDIKDADESLNVMTDTNNFEFKPSFLCAWCPLAKICPQATIKPYQKMTDALATQPDPEILLKGIELR